MSGQVTANADRLEHGSDETAAWVTYRVHDITVKASTPVGGKFLGPTEITFSGGEVTTEVLRDLPLADVRKMLRWLHAESSLKADETDYRMPERMESGEAYARFVELYNRAKAANPDQPAYHLAVASGVSIDTIYVRIQRCRARGLID